MSIRKARPDEAVALHHLVLDAYGHYVTRTGKTPRPMREDYAARIATDEVWVLEEAGAVVGLLVLEEGTEGFLLDNVAVVPTQQHKGYGRALIAFAEDEARARACRHKRPPRKRKPVAIEDPRIVTPADPKKSRRRVLAREAAAEVLLDMSQNARPLAGRCTAKHETATAGPRRRQGTNRVASCDQVRHRHCARPQDGATLARSSSGWRS